MKRMSLVAVALVGLVSSGARAANTSTITVNVAANAINELAITGGPITLTVNTATAGNQPDAVSNNAATYAITTNQAKKITAALDTAMPTGMTLTLNAQAPTGATSAGAVTLTASAQDLVTSISQVAESGKTLTFGLSATVAAGVVASTGKTVTLTITN